MVTLLLGIIATCLVVMTFRFWVALAKVLLCVGVIGAIGLYLFVWIPAKRAEQQEAARQVAEQAERDKLVKVYRNTVLVKEADVSVEGGYRWTWPRDSAGTDVLPSPDPCVMIQHADGSWQWQPDASGQWQDRAPATCQRVDMRAIDQANIAWRLATDGDYWIKDPGDEPGTRDPFVLGVLRNLSKYHDSDTTP